MKKEDKILPRRCWYSVQRFISLPSISCKGCCKIKISKEEFMDLYHSIFISYTFAWFSFCRWWIWPFKEATRLENDKVRFSCSCICKFTRLSRSVIWLSDDLFAFSRLEYLFCSSKCLVLRFSTWVTRLFLSARARRVYFCSLRNLNIDLKPLIFELASYTHFSKFSFF